MVGAVLLRGAERAGFEAGARGARDPADGGHEFWAALLAKAPAALRRPEWAELASLASTMSGRGSACRWALVISLVLRTWPGLRLFPALIWAKRLVRSAASMQDSLHGDQRRPVMTSLNWKAQQRRASRSLGHEPRR